MIRSTFFYLILFVAIIAGTYLVSQNQNISEKAASPNEAPHDRTANGKPNINDSASNQNRRKTPKPELTPTPSSTIGDVNRDGFINIIDIGILIDNYNLTPANPDADINSDDTVNIIDIGIVIDNYQN